MTIMILEDLVGSSEEDLLGATAMGVVECTEAASILKCKYKILK